MNRDRFVDRLFAIALLAAASSGCAAYGPSDAERMQIDAETAPYTQSGTGSVTGVVTLDTPRGPVVATVGVQVYLTPATTSALARLQEYGIEKNELPPSRHADLAWITTTDAQGRFKFDRLPAGEYIAASQMGWSPTNAPGTVKLDVAWARFRLGPGEQATIAVTRRDDG